MENSIKGPDSRLPAGDETAKTDASRRAVLRKFGRFAAVTPPVVTLLLSARVKPAQALISLVSSRQFKERVTVAPSRRPA